jgi:hypothetical protein
MLLYVTNVSTHFCHKSSAYNGKTKVTNTCKLIWIGKHAYRREMQINKDPFEK